MKIKSLINLLNTILESVDEDSNINIIDTRKGNYLAISGIRIIFNHVGEPCDLSFETQTPAPPKK